jgi:hypothetical protein
MQWKVGWSNATPHFFKKAANRYQKDTIRSTLHELAIGQF